MTTHFLLGRLLAQTTQSTQPAGDDSTVNVVLLVFAIAALAAFIARGLWRPTVILGPKRVENIRDIVALSVSFFVGATFWLGLPTMYFAFLAFRHPSPSGALTVDLSTLSAGELAGLTCIPAILAAAVLIISDRVLRASFPCDLGYDLPKAPGGMLKGLLAFLIVVPIMYWASMGVEWLYERLGYSHPNEVDLMRAMNEPGLSRIALIVGATVLAPIFEELFFRAHLQTVLRGFLFWLAEKFLPQPPPPIVPDAGFSGVLSYASPAPLPRELPRGLRVVLVWAAIVVTSIFFALLHEGWSEPMILVLAICLGFVYERTGNLWACITIHALFNLCETALYFGGR